MASIKIAHCLNTKHRTPTSKPIHSFHGTSLRQSYKYTVQKRHTFFPVRGHTETEAEVSRSSCPQIKEDVDLSTFQSIDLRVGVIKDAKTILDVEMTEKRGQPTMSRKYLLLKVDIGCEERTVVSECRFVMDVEDAVGKKVLLAANITPSIVEGVESHGVILAGLNYDPTPMPRSFKVILPGLGRLPPGSQVIPAAIPR